MKFSILANDDQWNSLQQATSDQEWIRVNSFAELLATKQVDAYFNLQDDACEKNYDSLAVPVFVNSVTSTLSEMKTKVNVVRVNAWTGFFEKELWEIAGTITSEIANTIKAIGKKYITVDDEPGFVSARIIAMIINEAYFAKEDGVSTEADIDIAMKLGTNYPYGPFEWAQIIGVKNVYDLLTKLSLQDEIYVPSKILKP
jgi:3-hydroxybutyryl-CoA dehydrogenase